MTPNFDRLEGHRCPKRCHRCPELARAIRQGVADGTRQPPTDWRLETTMPGCMGTATDGPDACMCVRRRRKLKVADPMLAELVARVGALEARTK